MLRLHRCMPLPLPYIPPPRAIYPHPRTIYHTPVRLHGLGHAFLSFFNYDCCTTYTRLFIITNPLYLSLVTILLYCLFRLRRYIKNHNKLASLVVLELTKPRYCIHVPVLRIKIRVVPPVHCNSG